jgi:hypothetical protein
VAASPGQPAYCAGDHARAGLQHVDDRVRTLVGVGSIQHEEVRKAAHGDAEIGLRIQTPTIVQAFAAKPDDIETREVAAGLETRRQHQRVDIDHPTASGDHCCRGDPLDRIRHEFDVRTLHCHIVFFAEQDALAPERIPRSQRIAHCLVLDVSPQKVFRQLLNHRHPRVVGGQRGVVVLHLPQPPPLAQRGPRNPAESGALVSAVWPILFGHHPRWRALEYRQLRCGGCKFGDDLYPAGPGTDDRNPLAGQVDARVPLRGVHEVAGEFRDALDIGIPCRTEQTHRADDDVRNQGLTRTKLDVPVRLVFIPDEALHTGAQHEVAAQVEVIGHRLEV